MTIRIDKMTTIQTQKSHERIILARYELLDYLSYFISNQQSSVYIIDKKSVSQFLLVKELL